MQVDEDKKKNETHLNRSGQISAYLNKTILVKHSLSIPVSYIYIFLTQDVKPFCNEMIK